MCGDAELCCEGNFDVREMGSAVDASCGVVVVPGNKDMYL